MDTQKFTFKNDLLLYILPEGIPRNSLVILYGRGGSAKSVLLAEIAKDIIGAGEPLFYVSIDDDPATVVLQLEQFGLSVEEAYTKGLFNIIDGFSYLVKGKRGKLHPAVVDEIDPRNVDILLNTIIKHLDSRGVQGNGAVIIDSLNEVLLSLDPIKLIEFIKMLRASIAKTRKVLTVATLHTSIKDFKEYLYTIDYMVDGIIELKGISSAIAMQIPFPVKQVAIRKMKGVFHRIGWTLFSIDRSGVKPVIIKYKEK